MGHFFRNKILRELESINEAAFNNLIKMGVEDNYQEKELKKVSRPGMPLIPRSENISNSSDSTQKINLNKESRLLKDYIKLLLS